jgi:hypothetical protein
MAGSGEVRQQIGVTAPRHTRKPEGFLVHRSGCDRLDDPTLRITDRADNDVVGNAARERAQHSWNHLDAIGRVQHRLADCEHTRVRGGLGRYFRTNAGRITDRNRNDRIHRVQR